MLNYLTCLREAFTTADPKRVKIQSSCQYLFALLGSDCVKALIKMLMNLTTGGRLSYRHHRRASGCAEATCHRVPEQRSSDSGPVSRLHPSTHDLDPQGVNFTNILQAVFRSFAVATVCV